MNEQEELVLLLKEELDIVVPESDTLNQLRELLTERINGFIQSDLTRLFLILYRVDVSESKLRALLESSAGENAAGLIADLIIERQLQKIKSRRENRKRDNDIDENEKW